MLRRADALFGCELIHLYGATELSPLATIFRHEEQHIDSERAKSCGPPPPGVDLRIVRTDGSELPAGEPGEVAVRGPNVMAGYWNKPAETAAALLEGGWYRTGDVGYVDAEGYLFLVDRAKDMIVSGGENVYCTEVEDALYTHPGVLEATVFGIPDAQWGEAVHAVVVPRDGAEVDEAGLIAHCRGRHRRLQDAQEHCLPRRAAAQVGPGQGAQARAARALLGGPRPRDQLSAPAGQPVAESVGHERGGEPRALPFLGAGDSHCGGFRPCRRRLDSVIRARAPPSFFPG